jgi:putative sterol carrier protein
MNKTITVPESYIALVWETREAQKSYFQASLEAKKTREGIAYQRAKDLLREAKNLESTLDQQTDFYMAELRGSMNASDAIAALRNELDSDLEEARKEASNG